MTGKPPGQRSTKTTSASPNDVETFLARLNHPLDAEIRALRAAILGAHPTIGEEIKWNAPSFRTSEHFATVHLRGTKGIQLVLHFGAKPRPDAIARGIVADPTSMLQWRGPDRATVTFQDIADIELRQAALADIVRQWITFL